MKEYIKRAPLFRETPQADTEVCEMTAGQAIGEIVLQKDAPVADIRLTLKRLFDVVDMSTTNHSVIRVTAYHGYNLCLHTDVLKRIRKWIHSGCITYCDNESIHRFKFFDGASHCERGEISWGF